MAKFYIYRISGSSVPWTCVDTQNTLHIELTIDDYEDLIFNVDDFILGYQVVTGTVNYVFIVTDVQYSGTGDSVTLTCQERFLQVDGIPYDISALPGLGAGDVCEIDETTYNSIVSKFGVRSSTVSDVVPSGRWYQRIYMGAPGTTKTTKAEAFARTFSADIIRTTFHPATDYASFVGCYKPESYPDPADPAKYLIKYDYCEQPFIQAYCRAWKYKASGQNIPVVLIIEEINRANCAQAFGDIFQLLDRSSASAITPEKSLKDHLNRLCPESLDPDGKMNLPDNLSILATMNTSDQSLFPIDSAFLRRWERVYIRIDYTGVTPNAGVPSIDCANLRTSANLIMTFGGTSYKWIDFLSRVNGKIGGVLMDEKKLGNYAIKENISSTQFIGGVLSYLWDGVCKDLDKEDDSYFMRRGDAATTPFSFWDVVDSDETEQEAILQDFMKYLGVPEIPTAILSTIPGFTSAPASPTTSPASATPTASTAPDAPGIGAAPTESANSEAPEMSGAASPTLFDGTPSNIQE